MTVSKQTNPPHPTPGRYGQNPLHADSLFRGTLREKAAGFEDFPQKYVGHVAKAPPLLPGHIVDDFINLLVQHNGLILLPRSYRLQKMMNYK